ANGVEQLRRRLEQINSDIDLRLGQGQPRSTPPGSSAAGTADGNPAAIALRGLPPGATPAPSRSPGSLMPSGTVVPPPRNGPSGAGTLTPPGSTPPRPEPVDSANPGSLRPASAGAL